MSTRRIGINAAAYRRQHLRMPGQCTWCGGEVPRARMTFCGQACVDAFLVRTSPSHARRMVMARDVGICALCGANTLEVHHAIEAARLAAIAVFEGRTEWGTTTVVVGGGHPDVPMYGMHRVPSTPAERLAAATDYLAVFARHGLKPPVDDPAEMTYAHVVRHTRHLWEMDHVLPVAEGGGECDMDNLRTLCVPCHRVVTRELKARLAAAKREAIVKSAG